MNIIKTKDTSRHGNDCYIYETVSLVEQFGVFAVIVCEKIVGWSEDEDIRVEHTTNNSGAALRYFNDFVALRED
jgi:hypothetical protein